MVIYFGLLFMRVFFNKIQVNYGVQVDDIELRWPMRLIHKETGKQILLIDGLPMLKGESVVMSYILYEAMRTESPEELCKIAELVKLRDERERLFLTILMLVVPVMSGLCLKITKRNAAIVMLISTIFYVGLRVNWAPYWYPTIIFYVGFVVILYLITAGEIWRKGVNKRPRKGS